MKNLIEFLNYFKVLFLIVMINEIRCEIIMLAGNPNHRHFTRTAPIKNEDNLRASGLIPINRNQFDSNQQTLIPPSTSSQSFVNHNFEYSKRMGMPAKRSTYMQNTRNQIDHSSYSPPANGNFYEREKQKIFNHDEMAHPQTNSYQTNYRPPSSIHQPQNYGYIPSNANNHDYHRSNQYDQLKNNDGQYNQQYNSQYGNQGPYQAHNHEQQKDNQQDYQQNNDLDKGLNDMGLDGSFYDMPFNQELDDNGQLFNDALNFDMPNFY